jgi:hypothetical protein
MWVSHSVKCEKCKVDNPAFQGGNLDAGLATAKSE